MNTDTEHGFNTIEEDTSLKQRQPYALKTPSINDIPADADIEKKHPEIPQEFDLEYYQKLRHQQMLDDNVPSSANEQINERALLLMRELAERYHQSGKNYFIKDRNGNDIDIAFTDTGTKLQTTKKDPATIDALLKVAETKGWENIKVSGNPEFKKEMWLEGMYRGFNVEGYKPSKDDLELLAIRQQEVAKNTIMSNEPKAPRERTKQGSDVDLDPLQKRAEIASKTPQRKHPDTLQGRVVDHGSANYNHDPDEKMSYFVKLDTPAGEKTIWGIDLGRATQESDVRVGDKIELKNLGKKEVTVETNIRDDKGNVIGTKNIATHRNEWNISVQEKVVTGLAEKIVASKKISPKAKEQLTEAVAKKAKQLKTREKLPAPKLHDKNAPSKSNTQAIQPPAKEPQRGR